MSAYADESPAPLDGASVAARLLGVDVSQALLALAQVGAVNRPVGLSLIGCISMQDTRRTLGFSTDPAVTLARYLTAR